jgi:hypothetical protein
MFESYPHPSHSSVLTVNLGWGVDSTPRPLAKWKTVFGALLPFQSGFKVNLAIPLCDDLSYVLEILEIVLTFLKTCVVSSLRISFRNPTYARLKAFKMDDMDGIMESRRCVLPSDQLPNTYVESIRRLLMTYQMEVEHWEKDPVQAYPFILNERFDVIQVDDLFEE